MQRKILQILAVSLALTVASCLVINKHRRSNASAAVVTKETLSTNAPTAPTAPTKPVFAPGSKSLVFNPTEALPPSTTANASPQQSVLIGGSKSTRVVTPEEMVSFGQAEFLQNSAAAMRTNNTTKPMLMPGSKSGIFELQDLLPQKQPDTPAQRQSTGNK